MTRSTNGLNNVKTSHWF